MDNYENSRRHFFRKTAMATAMLVAKNQLQIPSNQFPLVNQPGKDRTWYKEITRWGQVNISEKDPPQYDIPWWTKYWKDTHTEGVIINAGGIVAYYPSQIPLHRKAEYLGGRDLFGELRVAAQQAGVAVFARMDSNRAHEEFFHAHPDWFAVNAKGEPYKAGDLYITCINGPYYERHIPSILKEIAELYKPEGFTDNSWSGLGRDSICYCENCKSSFVRKTGKDIPLEKNWNNRIYKEWIRWNYDRRLEVWDLNNQTTKAAGGPNCIWSGMNSGSISAQSKSFRDLKEIAKKADIIMLDYQSRTEEGGFAHNGETGKLIHGLLGWEKLVPESMAMYQAHKPWFRLASKPEPEARMWMIEGIAGGIQPWWHMIGAHHEDRRMYHSPVSILEWHKINEEYLVNREPIADVGVVWSQENIDYFGKDDAADLVELPFRGIAQALTRARITYIPVHADHIDRDRRKVSVLVLPNFAAMSDEQVAAVRRFVEDGGSLVATGETSLYDHWGNVRNDFALADIFGAHMTNETRADPIEKLAGDAYHTYLRLYPEVGSTLNGPHSMNEPPAKGKRHPILKGFDETDTIPYGGLLHTLTVDPGTEVLMTYIPQFPVYPPEKAYMREPRTNIPGLIIRSSAKGGRVAYLPADIDRQFGRNNLPDHGDLLKNIILWAAKEELSIVVNGAGLIDTHLYEQKERMVLHLINLTNHNTWRQPLDELISVGPIKVKVKLRPGVKGKQVRTLVSKMKLASSHSKDYISFEVKSILDHEVIIIS